MSKRIRRGLLCAVMLAGACSRDLSILAPTGELSLTVPGKHDDHSAIIALALAGTNSCDVVSRRPTDPPEKARKTRVVLALPAQLAGRKRVRTVDPVEEGQVVESKAPIGVARLVRWDPATGAKILDASCAIPATKEAVAFTRRYLSSAANDLGVSQGSNLRVQPGYSNLIETMQCWYDPAEDSVDCGGVTCARVYAQLRTASIVGSSSIMSNLGDGDVFLCANDCVVANWATISCGGGSGVFGGPVDGGGGGSTGSSSGSVPAAAPEGIDQGLYEHLNPTEKTLCHEHNYECAMYLLDGNNAFDWVREAAPDGAGHNDAWDAMRHAYFMAMLARDIGGGRALVWGSAHESENSPEIEATEGCMDRYNNNVGASIGANRQGWFNYALQQLVIAALGNNQLKTQTCTP
jgi:hypothetical protein